MNPLLEKLLGDATRLTRNGKLTEATAAIQRALGSAVPRTTPARVDPGAGGAAVLDGLVRELPRHAPDSAFAPHQPHQPRPSDRLHEPNPPSRPYPPAAGAPAAPAQPASPAAGPTAASFEESAYTGRSGTRGYKLFVPAGYGDRALPLVVMLHGCTQNPDDFAVGTRMNELAQQRGFLVLYPAQAPRSNSSKCWNWFVPGDQRRGVGEPDLLAGMTRHIMQTHAVDPTRVYIAGLSAGGAMADIMGREYPELYAAVGVHSGLPQGAAHDVASAFAAMHSGVAGGNGRAGGMPVSGIGRQHGDRGANAGSAAAWAPTIVFHGDRDSTVHPSNGEQVVGAVLGASAAGADGSSTVATSEKTSAAGRTVTRTVHRRQGAENGTPSLAEHWVVHGAGHAWSGGSPAGSYTDAAGPDASREMVRFFEEHPRHSHRA